MQVNERKLDNYTDLSWAASATKKLALPRERFIERIRMLLTITGTGTVTAADGGVAAQISNIKIVGNGDTLVNIKPQDLKRAMDIELGRLGKTNTPVSGTGTGGLMELILPFNPTPRNLFNFKCALPAYAFNSLDLVIDWGTAAAIGAGYVTSAATLQVQMREVYLTEG